MGRRRAVLGVAVVATACSRVRDDGKEARALAASGSAAAAPSASAFVWPLGGSADGGEHAPPRKGMIWIPAGTLVAGTPKERTPRIADEELPGERIELAGFYIDEFAYPNEAGGIPKTGLTRDEAAGVCAAQEKRLCTELEWERACKGPSNTTYEYGDGFRAAECAMGQSGRLAPSGLRVMCRSAFGVHDMHGGPWEWTQSVWRRGGTSQAGVVRGGNSDLGELVGRCANAIAIAPATRRSDVSVRCCAGETNAAEVKLPVTRGKTLDAQPIEPPMVAKLAEAIGERTLPELPADEPFRIDRVWHWHPVGNEELVVAAGCARGTPHLSCGVGVFRATADLQNSDEPKALPMLVGFASSGWWMPVVKKDQRDRDLWVYGGDAKWSFRRRVAYVWGRIAFGEPEKSSPHGLEE
jgi:formylglycine-generating enzyme required for sulfatase activity